MANTGDRYVATKAIREAARGRESDILDALGIDWRAGRPHIQCSYPGHDDRNASWRWDPKKTLRLLYLYRRRAQSRQHL
jgi:hypothetical protein